MRREMTFREWFSMRSGTRDLMTVSPRVRMLPCGCLVQKNTFIRKTVTGWVHDCIKVASTKVCDVRDMTWQEADHLGFLGHF